MNIQRRFYMVNKGWHLCTYMAFAFAFVFLLKAIFEPTLGKVEFGAALY